MSKEDIPKTAVITYFGLFKWLRVPFALRNSSCTFQRMMNQILNIPHCFVYGDVVLIASPNAESHLRQVLDCLHLQSSASTLPRVSSPHLRLSILVLVFLRGIFF